MFAKSCFRAVTAITTASALLLTGLPGSLACGPFFPPQYLAEGGTSLLTTPEFFAEIELKLLARDYPTPFRAVRDEAPQHRMQDRDLEDFEASLKAGAIHPPDADTARQAHRRMRAVLLEYSQIAPADVAALPEDVLDEIKKDTFPSEFADYHEGALAYAAGQHDNARAIWERLLARPAAERRYRSVPAAFMIGVLGVVEDWDDAPQWFARARKFAQQGFHDGGGLAAASYLRESEWHEQRGDLHTAAEFALRSISCGYSTRTCIQPKDGSPEELRKFAADPLLRNIHTSLLLADYSGSAAFTAEFEPWLQAIEAAKTASFVGAERIAWLCYTAGDYQGARRWLAHAPRDSSRALWLTGKLAARDGRRADSLRAYSAAARQLLRRPDPTLDTELSNDDETSTPADRIAAEHGIAAIGASDFRQALTAFLHGGHWEDACYVAERLLTIEELRKCVDARPWKATWAENVQPAGAKVDPEGDDSSEAAAKNPEAQQTANLRWLLARRLARAGRFREARVYLPPEWRPALDRYRRGLAAGRNSRLSADVRSQGFWQAALEARHHGMELFGTEAAPDWSSYGGDFVLINPAPYRTGAQKIVKDPYSPTPKESPVPAVLRARAPERARLARSQLAVEKRFHYRYEAAELGWKAASLVPDNEPRLAAMLNISGRWLAARDPKAADRFYQALENRCFATDLGAKAKSHRWFVEDFKSPVPTEPEHVSYPPR